VTGNTRTGGARARVRVNPLHVDRLIVPSLFVAFSRKNIIFIDDNVERFVVEESLQDCRLLTAVRLLRAPMGSYVSILDSLSWGM
jgi:hypothetical protein